MDPYEASAEIISANCGQCCGDCSVCADNPNNQ